MLSLRFPAQTTAYCAVNQRGSANNADNGLAYLAFYDLQIEYNQRDCSAIASELCKRYALLLVYHRCFPILIQRSGFMHLALIGHESKEPAMRKSVYKTVEYATRQALELARSASL